MEIIAGYYEDSTNSKFIHSVDTVEGFSMWQ